MSNKDKYIVCVEKIGNRFYYKNDKLHREEGPAYVPWGLKDKYVGLADQDLYKLVCKEYVDEPQYTTIYFIDEMPGFFDESGKPIKLTQKQLENHLRLRPKYPCYHLEGIEYSKEEFDAIMLDKKLPKNGSNKVKVKI